jgi:hypothetical protein
MRGEDDLAQLQMKEEIGLGERKQRAMRRPQKRRHEERAFGPRHIITVASRAEESITGPRSSNRVLKNSIQRIDSGDLSG